MNDEINELRSKLREAEQRIDVVVNVLRDAPRLAAEHGGEAKGWSKVSGGSHVAKDGTKIETHAYQNGNTVVEPKTKLIDEGK
jgi:hypothetical protein